MEKKKAALHNLGCKVNAYETEAMQELLEKNGYEIVPFAPGADLYVINTCSVTNIADRKSRQMLHKAKKMNPNAIVVAAGCYVQAAGEELLKDPAVDLVIGNNRKKDLIRILEEYQSQERTGDGMADLGRGAEYEELHISHTAEHTRAYIKVQDGCNQFCSYCIIPYTRGRIRSRDPQDALAEVRLLAEKGFREDCADGNPFKLLRQRQRKLPSGAALASPRRGGHRPHPPWFFGTPRYHGGVCKGRGGNGKALSPLPSLSPERMRRHPEADESSLYRWGIL